MNGYQTDVDWVKASLAADILPWTQWYQNGFTAGNVTAVEELTMARKTKAQKLEGVRLTQKALNSLRATKIEPGFDYAAALDALGEIYDSDQIAEFCRYANRAGIKKVKDGTIPSHPVGELIYILYIETFNGKDDYRMVPVPCNKPPTKRFQE